MPIEHNISYTIRFRILPGLEDGFKLLFKTILQETDPDDGVILQTFCQDVINPNRYVWFVIFDTPSSFQRFFLVKKELFDNLPKFQEQRMYVEDLIPITGFIFKEEKDSEGNSTKTETVLERKWKKTSEEHF